MNLYKCPRCGYSSNQKNDLRRHFLRKNQCPNIYANISKEQCLKTYLTCTKKEVSQSIICDTSEVSKSIICDTKSKNFIDGDKFKCPDCMKTFSKKNNLYRHIKHFCKGSINNITPDDHSNEISQLKKEIELLKGKPNNIQHIGVQNNNKIIQNNIYINPFGKENTNYITKEYVQNLVKDGPYACIQKLIKHIHFNPHHKENQNIKIPNKRDKFGMIYNGEKWIVENKIDMITTITENAFDIITEHCDDLNNKKYDRFCDEFETREKNCMKRINGDTELLILNCQD
jgi:uncharacterized C2H2 Zn-finger protein